jgi:hypothetical protein
MNNQISNLVKINKIMMKKELLMINILIAKYYGQHNWLNCFSKFKINNLNLKRKYMIVIF